MLNVLGQNQTNPSDNLTLVQAISKLDDTSTELLIFIAEELKIEKVEERGVYIEHDRYNCKPFNTLDVEALMDYGLINVHHSSANGVFFCHCNEDVYDTLVDMGEIFEE